MRIMRPLGLVFSVWMDNLSRISKQEVYHTFYRTFPYRSTAWATTLYQHNSKSKITLSENLHWSNLTSIEMIKYHNHKIRRGFSLHEKQNAKELT